MWDEDPKFLQYSDDRLKEKKPITKKERQDELFIGAVIIVALCAAVLYVGYIAYTYEAAITPAPRQEEQLTLPQRCHYLLKEQDPDDWDPETDTYPPNWAWRKCMGVA